MLRIQDASIRYVEGRNMKLLEHNLCHSFSVCGCVPSWFSHQDGMFGRIDAHNVDQRMRDQSRYRIEINNYILLSSPLFIKKLSSHSLNASRTGFPTSIPSLQIEGPFCPR